MASAISASRNSWMTVRTIGAQKIAVLGYQRFDLAYCPITSFRVMVRYSVGCFTLPTAYHDPPFFAEPSAHYPPARRGGVLRHLRRSSPSAHLEPLVQAPPTLRRAGCGGAPRNPKKPAFVFPAHFCHSAPMETHAFGFTLRANAPEGQKHFLSVIGSDLIQEEMLFDQHNGTSV